MNKEVPDDVSQHTNILDRHPTSLNILTLNFLNLIIHLGAICANVKSQVGFWHALIRLCFSSQCVLEAYKLTLILIWAKTSLGKLLLQKKRERENYMIYSNIKCEWFCFSMLFSLPFTDIWELTVCINSIELWTAKCINSIKPWTAKCPWGYTATLNTELLNKKKWANMPGKSRESWTSDVQSFDSYLCSTRGHPRF